MSLKRSRKQMSQANKQANNKTNMLPKKKSVQFCDDTTNIPPSSNDEDPALLWYSRNELVAQLEESRTALAMVGACSEFNVLLRHCYLQPHVNVQEYLNAFVAHSDASTCMRGMESSLEIDLKEERAQTRRQHKDIILQQQVVLHSLPVDMAWAKLCQSSRQSSAPSKLFAMRMGRADARWEENTEAAREIVEEHRRKVQATRKRAASKSPAGSYASLVRLEARSSFVAVQQ